MQRHYLALLAAITLMSSIPLLSQQTTIRKVPAPYTSAGSGKEMYRAYCASCHGRDAKGDGPAAGEVKVPPADLTALAKKNNGKFPSIHVSAVLSGQADMMAKIVCAIS